MKTMLSKSFEDYLEMLYMFEIGGNKEIMPSKLAEAFNVSKAAITKAMNKLLEDGFISKQTYGHILLTDKGREIGKSVYDKHINIKEFLIKIGVSEENAEIDCCKIEHVICDETLEKMKLFNSKK